MSCRKLDLANASVRNASLFNGRSIGEFYRATFLGNDTFHNPNDYTQIGTYYSERWSPTPIGVTVLVGTLKVMANHSTWVMQMFVCHEYDDQTFVRYYNGTKAAWGNWKRVFN